MAKKLIELKLGSGGTALVEVEDADLPVEARRVAAGGVVARLDRTLEESLGRVRAISDAVLSQLQQMASAPSEIGVELSFKMTGKADFVLVGSSLEGSVKVTLKWSSLKKA
jgi:hypothetical protein